MVEEKTEVPEAEEELEPAHPLWEDTTSDFEVEAASLSDEAQEMVYEAVDEAEGYGTLDELDQDQLIEDAKAVSESQARAEAHGQAQDDATEAGDYAEARDQAQQARAEYQNADNLTEPWTSPDNAYEVMEADQDADSLDAADWNQEIADDEYESATDYIEAGEFDVAEDLEEDAADDDEVAEAYAEEAGDADSDDDDHYAQYTDD